MYLPNEYRFVLYYNLIHGLKEEAEALDPLTNPNWQDVRAVLRKLQVRKIRGFPVDSVRLVNRDISSAMTLILRGIAGKGSEIKSTMHNRALKGAV